MLHLRRSWVTWTHRQGVSEKLGPAVRSSILPTMQVQAGPQAYTELQEAQVRVMEATTHLCRGQPWPLCPPPLQNQGPWLPLPAARGRSVLAWQEGKAAHTPEQGLRRPGRAPGAACQECSRGAAGRLWGSGRLGPRKARAWPQVLNRRGRPLGSLQPPSPTITGHQERSHCPGLRG